MVKFVTAKLYYILLSIYLVTIFLLHLSLYNISMAMASTPLHIQTNAKKYEKYQYEKYKKDIEFNAKNDKRSDKDSFNTPPNYENDSGVQLNCTPTPALWNIIPKPQIYSTNDLRRYVGSPNVASGEFIQIIGRVFDSNCVPLPNVTVQIWQADNMGRYKYGLDEATYWNSRVLYNKSPYITGGADMPLNYAKESAEADSYFTGSGSTSTDNLGRYTFFTIMPGGSDDGVMSSSKSTRGDRNESKFSKFNYHFATKMIHFYIKHRDFWGVETFMLFPEYQDVNRVVIHKYVSNGCIGDENIAKATLVAKDSGKVPISGTIAMLNKNNNENTLKNYNEQNGDNKMRVYTFDIVLGENSKYREY